MAVSVPKPPKYDAVCLCQPHHPVFIVRCFSLPLPRYLSSTRSAPVHMMYNNSSPFPAGKIIKSGERELHPSWFIIQITWSYYKYTQNQSSLEVERRKSRRTQEQRKGGGWGTCGKAGLMGFKEGKVTKEVGVG